MPLRLVLYLIILLPALATAQDRKLSIQSNQQPLREVMDRITEISGYTFAYNTKKIRDTIRVNLDIHEGTLEDILGALEDETGYTFELIEKQIVVKRPTVNGQLQSFTIKGFVSDLTNGESLVGTSVRIVELSTGTSTNLYGFYSLTLPSDIYTLEYSFVGYETQTHVIDLLESTTLDIAFVPAKATLDEVVVIGLRPPEIQEIQVSKTHVSKKEFSEIPSLMGELDVIKGLQSVPGIKMFADGSTFFSVRGGAKDQNLIQLDEGAIYNPSHLLGLFSSVVPEAINDLSIYKGDLPASFGGRLSSVINIKTNDGNDKHLSFWGNVGLISAKAGIEAPVKKDKSSVFLAARRSHLRWFFEQSLDSRIEKLHFYDITGKVNIKLGDRDRLFASFYTGTDTFEQDNSGISWSNSTGTIRWNHLFSDKLFANTTLHASGYDYFLNVNLTEGTKWVSHIDNVNLKSDLSWFLSPDNLINFGIGIGGYQFDPGNIRSDVQSFNDFVSTKNVTETILYAENERKIMPNVGLRYGIRFSRWSNYGDATEYVFNENGIPTEQLQFEKGQRYNSYNTLEPRLNLSYFISEESSLKFSYNHLVQNMHLITNSISPFTTLDVWLPSSLSIKPQHSDQFTFGYAKSWPSGLVFSTEGYYKWMENQIDYQDHANLLLNPFYEGQLHFGKAVARGIETRLKKGSGRLHGWLGYTYSRVTHTFDDLNQGRSFPGFFDRPHEINIVMSYDISLRIQLGANWIYTSGAPFSSPTAFYYYDGQELPVYGTKNNDRFPDYHRLDLSARFQLDKGDRKFKHYIGLSIYNLYAAKNPVFVNFNKIDAGSEFRVPGNLFTAYRQSTQTLYYNFIPSIMYSFRFR